MSLQLEISFLFSRGIVCLGSFSFFRIFEYLMFSFKVIGIFLEDAEQEQPFTITVRMLQ